MRPRHLLTLIAFLLAIAGIVAYAGVLLRRDRAALVDELARDRFTLLQEAARRFESELADIADSVRFAATLAHRPGPVADLQREMTALVEVIGQFKELSVYDAAGERRLDVADHGAPEEVQRGGFARALAGGAAGAFERAGHLATSLPIAQSPGPEYRVFAYAEPGSQYAVAVLVDVKPLFEPLELVSRSADTRLMLLGAHGRPTSATDELLTRALSGGTVPEIADVVREVRQGAASCRGLPARAAEAIGLPDAEAVACYLPVPVEAGEPWSVATFSSTRSIAASERRLVLRLGATTVAAAGLICLLAAYVVIASRRALQLRESRLIADQLAQLHERTRRVLDHLPSGVVALSADRTVTFVNRMLAQRAPAAAPGQRVSAAFASAPAGAQQKIEQLLDAAYSSGEVQSVFAEPLALFGEEGQYNLHAVPLGPDPAIRCVLVVEDTSKVHALESQLVRAEKLATIGVLAAGIAHEVGTPLGVVRGRAEYVIGKLGAGHPQASGLNVIIQEIDRVTRTLRQLLDFSRIQPAAVRPVPAAGIVGAVRELLRVEAQRRSVALEADAAEGLPPLSADPDQLQQVLVNLALNALDACSAGGHVRLRARPGEGGRSVLLQVEDDGAGIPEAHRAQVFDPFFTTKKRGQGTGLGLTVVAQLVRNHGADLRLESREGEGTTVTLEWPAALGAQEAIHAAI